MPNPGSGTRSTRRTWTLCTLSGAVQRQSRKKGRRWPGDMSSFSRRLNRQRKRKTTLQVQLAQATHHQSFWDGSLKKKRIPEVLIHPSSSNSVRDDQGHEAEPTDHIMLIISYKTLH